MTKLCKKNARASFKHYQYYTSKSKWKNLGLPMMQKYFFFMSNFLIFSRDKICNLLLWPCGLFSWTYGISLCITNLCHFLFTMTWPSDWHIENSVCVLNTCESVFAWATKHCILQIVYVARRVQTWFEFSGHALTITRIYGI